MSWRRSTRLILCAAVCAALAWSGAAGAGEQDRGSDRISALPGLGPVATPQYGGYASVTDDACATVRCDGPDEAGLYYWFVAAPDATRTTPTILWTNGGPGATSFWGFFTENGPYVVRRDERRGRNASTRRRDRQLPDLRPAARRRAVVRP